MPNVELMELYNKRLNILRMRPAAMLMLIFIISMGLIIFNLNVT